MRGPFQEVQMQVHSLAEVDKPAFWKFLDAAMAGFGKFTDRVRQNPEDVMPWRVLGQKWHLARKGFPPGKPPQWDVDVLEELCELLREAAPRGQFLWNNQQLVHVFVPQQSEPWASLHTKRPAGLDLTLTGPKGHFALGRITKLGVDREFQTGPKHDTLRLRFQSVADLEQGDLRQFLAEHLASLGSGREVAGLTA
jgi:excinuclease ABC subunit A